MVRVRIEERIISVMVGAHDGNIFDESAFKINIEDEAGGEFVSVEQDGRKISIDKEEWPILCSAIDKMIQKCRT